MAKDKDGNVDVGKTLNEVGNGMMGCGCLLPIVVLGLIALYGALFGGH